MGKAIGPQDVRSLIRDYRPEQHYLHGPGPKARLKQVAG